MSPMNKFEDDTAAICERSSDEALASCETKDSAPAKEGGYLPPRAKKRDYFKIQRNSLFTACEQLMANSIDQEEIQKAELSDQMLKSIENLEKLLDASAQMEATIQKELELMTNNLRLLDQSLFHDEFVAEIESQLDVICETLFFFVATGRFCARDKWGEVSGRSKNTGGIEVAIHEDIAVIHMPYIPGKYKGNYSIINERLESKLRQCKDFPKWKSWKAEFIHVFPAETQWIPRDVNNYDYKRTVDVIALAMKADDNCLDFEMAMRTVFSDEIAPGTYIEITPNCSKNAMLPKW